MKVLSLDGLTEYTTALLNKITTLLSSKSDINHTHNYLPLTGGTISGKLTLSSCNAMMARHLDGSTDGYTGELYLNYNNPNADIYLGTGHRITNNGSYYTGTSANADTVDGVHASSFAMTGYASTDINAMTTSGMYRLSSGHTNAPSASDWGQLIVSRGGGDTIAQFIFDFNQGRCWLRTGNPPDCGGVGSWTEWRQLYTSQNITYGTSALTPGSSSLATGSFYYQYE